MNRSSIHTGPIRCIAHPWVVIDDGCWCEGYHQLAWEAAGDWCPECVIEADPDDHETTEA